jgi:poly(3-hydroxybutyrate) depolymerase
MSAWAYQKEKIYINSGGKQRNILVYTPDELPAGSPLFITTHGMGGNSENQAEHDRMYELVDTAKFVMVYPRADGDYWDISGTTDQNFIIKVIDEMATRLRDAQELMKYCHEKLYEAEKNCKSLLNIEEKE